MNLSREECIHGMLAGEDHPDNLEQPSTRSCNLDPDLQIRDANPINADLHAPKTGLLFRNFT